MTSTPALKQTPRLVEKIYEYKGIKVGVRIDFRTKQISLTETDGQGTKRWVFAGRGLAYMAGWRNILEAMKRAINAAEAELKIYVEEQEKAELELMARVAREM